MTDPTSRSISPLAILSLLSVCTVVSIAAPVPPASAADSIPLYVEIASAYLPLSQCLKTKTQAYDSRPSDAMLKRIDLVSLKLQAAEIVGTDHPLIQSHQEGADVNRVRALLLALATYAAGDWHSDRELALAAKAIALWGVLIAEADGGRCTPSPNLLGWMAQVPPVNR